MSERPRVGIAGATGAVGKELVAILDRVPWRPEELVALARLRSRETSLTWGEGRVGVDSLEDMDFSGLDLLFVALPRPEAPAVLRAALEADVKVVDLSGVASELYDAPLCVPWVNPEGWSPAVTVVSIPEASSTLVGSVLAPLTRAGLVGRAQATVLAPASVKGHEGIAELSNQVVALLNAQTPNRQRFPDGLAFDLEPFTGVLQEDGRADGEARAVQQVRSLLGEDLELDVAVVGVPLFSGIAMQMAVETARNLEVDLVRQILAEGGVRMDPEGGVRSAPRPRKVEGHPFAHAGRVRLSADGRGLHLFAAMDNLHTAGLAAVSCGRLMWEQSR